MGKKEKKAEKEAAVAAVVEEKAVVKVNYFEKFNRNLYAKHC
jgi:hypothetical protein